LVTGTNQRESIRDKTSLNALTRLVCKAGSRLRLKYGFLTIPAPSHAVFSRIEPVRKPYGSRSTCHCHVGLSNRSAVEKMAPKVAFAKQKQLAQKTVGSRDHCTSRVCSGLVDGVAQGCNIRSPVALA
jgi:hypothetical protein